MLRKKVVENCKLTLESKLNFPNQEAHTKFEKFVSNGLKGEKAETAWRDFYQDEKNQELWPGAKSKENARQLEAVSYTHLMHFCYPIAQAIHD